MVPLDPRILRFSHTLASRSVTRPYFTESPSSTFTPHSEDKRDFLPLALLNLDALENQYLEPCYVEIPFKGSSVACISTSAARKKH
jgi:hypothetical protein